MTVIMAFALHVNVFAAFAKKDTVNPVMKSNI